MNKYLVIGIVALLVAVGGGVYYYYTQSDQYAAKYGRVVSVEKGPSGVKTAPERKVEGQVIPSEDGWSLYTSNEWGLTFSYPSSWKLTEQNGSIFVKNDKVISGGRLETVRVAGDGYGLNFSKFGKGIPTGVDTTSSTYQLSGRTVWVFQDREDPGYTAFIKFPVCSSGDGFGFVITSPTSSKEVTNKIIASIKCSDIKTD